MLPLNPIAYVFDDDEVESEEGFVLHLAAEQDDSNPQKVSFAQSFVLVRVIDDGKLM